MSNSKISALTAAATVVGTEVLPIVQSSATVKATVANLTPGLATITAAKGGTGQTSYAVGDIIYADTTTTLAKLADVATGNALISGGVSTAPSWGKIGLTTHVSGTLPIANGGTNLTTAPPMFSAYSSSTQTPTSGTATKVIFGTESFDTNNNFASSRFTATIAGYYQFSACVSCAADILVTFILLQFYKNGSQQVDIVGANSYGTQNTTSPQTLSTSSLIYLAATDYVEVYATVTGTGGNRYIFNSNVNYPTVFTGALIR